MYQIGDFIICGDSGVCQVESVGLLDMSWIDKSKLYYTLCPVYRDGKIYVPTTTNIFMRPIVSHQEALHLIDTIPSIEEIDCYSFNFRELKGFYNQLLQTHNCIDLIKLIKTIYIKNGITIEQGKQPGQIDHKFMKQAEELLHGEFAVALGIAKENVGAFISNRINNISCAPAL